MGAGFAKYVGGGICGIGILLMIILLPLSIKKVSHDEYGIRYDGLTKKVHDDVYDEGKHLCTPQTQMYTYDRTIQKLELNMSCLSSNGIEIEIEVDIQYQIPKSQVYTIFDEFGEFENLKQYLMVIADDSVRFAIRLHFNI